MNPEARNRYKFSQYEISRFVLAILKQKDIFAALVTYALVLFMKE